MRCVLIALLILGISTDVAAQELESKERDPGIRVSLINLIATPEVYHKKLVFVTGFASIEFENNNLCLSKDRASTKDCVWINYDDGPYETGADLERFKKKESEWKKYNGKRISIRGVFDAKNTGHLGGSSGGIGHIIDVYDRR